MSDYSKKQLIQAGIFSGAVLIMFLLLAFFAAIARGNWERGLRAALDETLEESGLRSGKFIPLKSALSTSAALFELEGEGTAAGNHFVLIVRETSSWGPLPAVFVYRDGRTSFAGIAYMKSSVARNWTAGADDRQTGYWQDRAAQIFERAALQKKEAK